MRERLFGLGHVVAGLSWLLASGTAVADPILIPPLVQVAVDGNPIVGNGIATAEFDNTSNNGGSIVLHALANADGPFVHVSGEGNGGFGTNGTNLFAQADYQFVVLGPSISGPVPISITAMAEADATGGADSGGFAEAYVSSSVPRRDTGLSFLVSAQQCTKQVTVCTGSPSTAEDSAIALARPGLVYQVNVYADARGGGQDTWNIDALADPIIHVSDALIPGTTQRYSDVFSLELSPGVTQGLGEVPAVPEPGTWLLLVFGTVGIVLRLKREFRRG